MPETYHALIKCVRMRSWKIFVLILIARFSFAQTVIDFPYDIRDCGFGCTSKDLTPLGAYLASDITGTPFIGCTAGTNTNVFVCVSIDNTTNSERKGVSLAVDLNINGVLVTEIIKCVDIVVKGDSTVNLCFGPYSWICGQTISMTNIMMGWDDAGANSGCPTTQPTQCNDYNLHPKCRYLTNTVLTAFQADYNYTLLCPLSTGNYRANFVADPEGGIAPYTYSWNFGSGASPATATTATVNNVSWSTPGVKTVTLTVTDSGNKTFISTKQITVSAPMQVSINGRTDTTICNANAQLTALVTNGYSPYTYAWSAGLGNTATVNTPTVSGTYTVTVTDARGCTKTASINLTYGVVNGGAGEDAIVCENDPAITLTATGGTSYSWSTGASTASIMVDPPSTTSYYVTITNAAGCTKKDTVVVTVRPSPTAGITGPDTICPGQQTILTGSGGGTYNWSTGATSSSIQVSPLTTTTYTLTVTAANLCTDIASKTVNISTINFNCETIINGGSPVSTCEAVVCVGESVVFTGVPFYNVGSYSWSGPNGFSSTGNTISLNNIQAANAGDYTLTYMGNGSCSFQKVFTLLVNTVVGGSIGTSQQVCVGGSPGAIGEE